MYLSIKTKDLEKKLEMKVAGQQLKDQQLKLASNQRISYLLAFFGMIVTITAIFAYKAKQKMQRLNQLVLAQKIELEEMGKVKDKIFSIVSHDMRAPVNNLISFGSILEEEQIPQEKLALYIDQIRGTLDHTSTMMENLLNWASSQMQGFEPMMELIEVQPILNTCIQGIRPALQKKHIELVDQTNTAVWVFADKNMLELIIRNLLSNALKFTHQNGMITINASMESNGIAILQFNNRGLGLSQDQIKIINSKSLRSLASSPGTSKEQGTGLGIMLCKHFVQIMNGSIQASYSQDQGTTFELQLKTSAAV